jgi:hypothetical protein
MAICLLQYRRYYVIPIKAPNPKVPQGQKRKADA